MRRPSRLVGAVADDLEHEAVGIKEVGGVVLAVLGSLAGFMDDLGVVSNRQSWASRTLARLETMTDRCRPVPWRE